MKSIGLKELLPDKPMVSLVLWKSVQDYFQNDEHKKQFEEWYEKKYGEPYNWS